jgi:hypothetical protein
MTEITPSMAARAASTRLPDNDAGARTVGEFLVCLLAKLWQEEEEFDGKRPFGNSSWQCVVHKALIEEGLVDGELDEDGYIVRLDKETADRLILDVIYSLTLP